MASLWRSCWFGEVVLMLRMNSNIRGWTDSKHHKGSRNLTNGTIYSSDLMAGWKQEEEEEGGGRRSEEETKGHAPPWGASAGGTRPLNQKKPPTLTRDVHQEMVPTRNPKTAHKTTWFGTPGSAGGSFQNIPPWHSLETGRMLRSPAGSNRADERVTYGHRAEPPPADPNRIVRLKAEMWTGPGVSWMRSSRRDGREGSKQPNSPGFVLTEHLFTGFIWCLPHKW